MNTIQTHFWAVRDYLAPVLRESKFKEHGRITPDEFVAAGDFLAYKFPTWSWSPASSSDAKYTRDFLPTDKQYLVSRGVPCLRRVSQMESAALGGAKESATGQSQRISDERLLDFGEGKDGTEGKGGDEDWLATHLDGESPSVQMGDIVDIPDSELPAGAASMTQGEEDDLVARVAGTTLSGSDDLVDAKGDGRSGDTEHMPEMRDIPDIDDEFDGDAGDDDLGGLGAGVEEEQDPATATRSAPVLSKTEKAGRNQLVSVRTYDCLITYDKYYQTPRMWLVGYDESGQPLKPVQIFEDISSDYAQKTVTVEPFPHANMSTASIHPCKHASVMKKVIERMDGGVQEEQRKAASSSKKKKGWGLGGAVRKVTGSGKEVREGEDTATETEEGTPDVDGLRVDQYLLIFLKFMASIVPAIEIDATQAM